MTQGGVVARRQLLGLGVTDAAIGAQLAAGRWARLHPGVYAVSTGPPPRATQLWAALLVSGPGSVLSHRTAAEEDGLVDDTGSLVHVSVPHERRVTAPAGVRVHRVVLLDARRHPARTPPRTRTEDTVVDLVDAAHDAGAVVDVLARAVQRRLTTPPRIRGAAGERSRLRWRALLLDVLADVEDGAETPLERHFLRGVERAHGLPRGTRQARTREGGWWDVRYDRWRVVVELDGRAFHPLWRADEDHARDNAAALHDGTVTLRYGWAAVTGGRCTTADQLATVLRARGWPGRARRCGPDCRLPT